MSLQISAATVANILTRTTGYLRTVTSHSLQPYRGCTFGRSLCGVGCYVRHNGHVTRGRAWGEFLEVRTNAADPTVLTTSRERRWARRRGDGRFSVFMSSATDPFVPQEARYGVTAGVLAAMRDRPPDLLILQTHTHKVARFLEPLSDIAGRCELRVHVSIESDRDSLPGLPPPASTVAQRLQACATIRAAGIWTVVTVSPLLPIADPDGFFAQIASSADAVVIDHFIGGDGSPEGGRTRRTGLPAAMAEVEPESVKLEYREQMADVARRHLPGRVGISIDGFAGRYT